MEKTGKPLEAILEKQAISLIGIFTNRNMEGIYVAGREEAAEEVVKSIPEGSKVALGGSVTLTSSGILERLRKGNYDLLDRYAPGATKEEIDRMRHEGLKADVFLSSVNAITSDGVLVAVDGTGNRVASLVFGPERVIIVASVDKIVRDEEDALDRIRRIAGPANAVRLGKKTPCAKTGICADDKCHPPERICNATLFLRGESKPGRTKIILVGEKLGY